MKHSLQTIKTNYKQYVICRCHQINFHENFYCINCNNRLYSDVMTKIEVDNYIDELHDNDLTNLIPV